MYELTERILVTVTVSSFVVIVGFGVCLYIIVMIAVVLFAWHQFKSKKYANALVSFIAFTLLTCFGGLAGIATLNLVKHFTGIR